MSGDGAPPLLPDGVGLVWARIGEAPPLHPEEEPFAASMSPARRREFATGRACARRALAAAGLAVGPVLRGERRAPRWPEGAVGSITHSDGWCAAAAAPGARWAGVGLDIEPWQPLSERALARIASERERAALAALPGGTPHWGIALFSAKETLYKALFPVTGLFLAFREAELALAPEGGDRGRFHATLLQRESAERADCDRFEGRFARAGDGALVATALALPRRPRSFGLPSY